MKARVLVEFKDKYKGEIYPVGKILTISKERYAEILEVGKYVEPVVEKKKG